MKHDMLLTTTFNIEGQPIVKYLGIVSGEIILGANIFRDIGAAIRNIIGGRAKAYETSLRQAKSQATQDLIQQAKALGANAIVGVRLDYEPIGQGLLMVIASGTAVIIE